MQFCDFERERIFLFLLFWFLIVLRFVHVVLFWVDLLVLLIVYISILGFPFDVVSQSPREATD